MDRSYKEEPLRSLKGEQDKTKPKTPKTQKICQNWDLGSMRKKSSCESEEAHHRLMALGRALSHRLMALAEH